MGLTRHLHAWLNPDPTSGSELVLWAKGRMWQARLPLVLVSAWYAVGWFGDTDRHTWFFGLNLGIHEAGHLLTGGFPTIVCAAAGSIFQCLAPLLAGVLFIRQRDFAALGFCLTWLASNLFYVALYVADASDMALPLLSVGGGEVYHDWNTILEQLGLLGREGFFSSCLRLMAFACALGGVLWTAWVMRVMATVQQHCEYQKSTISGADVRKNLSSHNPKSRQ